MRPKPRTVKYVVRVGSILHISADTRTEARRQAAAYCRSWPVPPVIERVEVAPDGRFVIDPPAIGGTWGGWPDGRIERMPVGWTL